MFEFQCLDPVPIQHAQHGNLILDPVYTAHLLCWQSIALEADTKFGTRPEGPFQHL